MDLEACPFCGAELDGQPDFCPACDRFLWESLEPTPPPAAMNAAESAPRLPSNPSKKGRRPPAETDQVPTLGVAERHVAVDPGDTQAVVVSILNTGSRVDEVDIVVDPPVAAFASVEPTVVNVYPQDKAEARVTFAPPRDTRIPAGTREWTIRATSRVSRQEATVSGTVDVLAFTAEGATLEPRQSTGWRRDFEHSVVLDNRGNAPWVVVLEPASSERVSLTADPASVTIPAGAVGAATIMGRAQRRFVGTGESIPLHLEVVTETGSGPPRRSIALEAARHQKALLPTWLLTAAVIVIGLALAAYAVFGNSADERGAVPSETAPEVVPTPSPPPSGAAPEVVRVPSVQTLTAAAATSLLEETGFEVQAASVQSELEEGAAVNTSPAEGQTAAQGSTVTLFVSAGPAPEETPRDLVTVTDDSQRISVQVPTSWTDIAGAGFTDSKGNAVFDVIVSSSVAGYRTGWAVSGVGVSASADAVENTSVDEILERFAALPRSSGCTLDTGSRQPYSDGLYSGSLDSWVGCGDVGSDYVLIAAVAEDGSHLIWVRLQMAPGDDWVMEPILASLQAVF